MIFVNTSLEVAQERNKRRSRKLPEKIVEKIWNDVQKNLGRFQGLFKQNFIIIDNSETLIPKAGRPLFAKEINSAIRRFLQTPIKSGIAKMWIKQQQTMRKT